MPNVKITPTDTRCPVKGCHHSALVRDLSGAGRLSEHMGRVILQCETVASHRWSVPVGELRVGEKYK
jgi:hypothetical protein